MFVLFKFCLFCFFFTPNNAEQPLMKLPKPVPAISKLLHKLPGEELFGIYRFLPFFAVLGAALEFVMIKWTVGDVNFYKVYLRNRSTELAEKKFENYLKKIKRKKNVL